MKQRAALLFLLMMGVGAQEPPVAESTPTTVPEDVAAKRLCGSTQSLGTRPQASSTCGWPLLHPVYPAVAKQAHIQGSVHLKAVIGTDGTVEELSVMDGHPLLTPAAIDAVKTWKYKPYYVDKRRVKFETVITVNFILEEEQKDGR